MIPPIGDPETARRLICPHYMKQRVLKLGLGIYVPLLKGPEVWAWKLIFLPQLFKKCIAFPGWHKSSRSLGARSVKCEELKYWSPSPLNSAFPNEKEREKNPLGTQAMDSITHLINLFQLNKAIISLIPIRWEEIYPVDWYPPFEQLKDQIMISRLANGDVFPVVASLHPMSFLVLW